MKPLVIGNSVLFTGPDTLRKRYGTVVDVKQGERDTLYVVFWWHKPDADSPDKSSLPASYLSRVES